MKGRVMSVDFSIKFKNYKCFTELNEISNIKKINLLIGRNNCGKTTILEIIESIFSSKKPEDFALNNCPILFKSKIDNSLFEQVFRKNCYPVRYFQPEQSYYELGKRLLNKECYFPIRYAGYYDSQYKKLMDEDSDVFSDANWDSLTRLVIDRIPKYYCYKISSERDIKKENRDADFSIQKLDSRGNGITNLFEEYLHKKGANIALITHNVLDSLNKILEGEDFYTGIQVLRDNKEKLEIYLCENDIRIPLSEMGSGLKTILFVLLLLYLSEEKREKSLFLFEELENNLHPEIQRRLFDFIYSFVKDKDAIVFITSHSHVAINCFYSKNDASVYHVKKTGNVSNVVNIENDVDKASILEDLGVLASDIFQSNGILWVEGPSDRIYIKKWLSLKYPNLEENRHFTFLQYGGKNLSHFTADVSLQDKMINMLLANRNSIIVIDHDGTNKEEEIRDTKKRVVQEFESNNLFAWITCGKEIENYLKVEDIKTCLLSEIENNWDENKKDEVKKAINELGQIGDFEKFSSYIEKCFPRFESRKLEFARLMKFNEDSLKSLDLESQIDKIANSIMSWNNIKI